MLQKLWQDVTRESLVTFCLDICLTSNIMVTFCKGYCGKDINAFALKCLISFFLVKSRSRIKRNVEKDNEHNSGNLLIRSFKSLFECHIPDWIRYGIEAANTWPIGRHLAILNSQLRNMISKKSILPIKTFCVGHSLGAHVCGFMGRESNVQLDKIIGMDPAGPIFEKNFEFDRLNSGSAKMVEAIHTNTGGFGLGIKKPVG